MKNARISLKAVALGSCAFGALMAAAAPAAAEQFAVTAQDLRPALQLFASQGDQQVLFSSAAVAGKSTGGFTGEASPEAALQQLLSGTDLIYSKTSEGALLVMTEREAREGRRPQAIAAPEGGNEVEGLIVTAQKREENIQDVPIAMSAFSQQDLTDRQVAGGPDLITQIPNMSFTKTNFTSYSIQIRGIGTQAISATTDPAVAVAFNNTPFVRNHFFEQEFYDLERLEVLRGPQGTLYGRNATAGVVNLISAKPKFTFGARASADLSNYSSSRLEGMVNIPLIEDVVALRLAGAWTRRDGFATNQMTGAQIDGRDLWSTRLSLRFEPTDWISANLIYEHFQEDDDRLRSGKQLCKKHVAPAEINGVPVSLNFSGGAQGVQTYLTQGCVATSLYSPEAFQTPNGFSLPYFGPTANLGNPIFSAIDPYLSAVQSRDLRVIESSFEPEYRANTDLAELQVSVDLTDSLGLAFETSYGADSLSSLQDYNRFTTTSGVFDPDNGFASGFRPDLIDDNGVFCDPQVGCSDRLLLVDLSTSESTQFSQEIRLSSDFDAPFNFSIGANYLRHDAFDKYYVFVNSLTLFLARHVGNPPLPWEPGVTDGSDCFAGGPAAVGDTALALDPLEVYRINRCAYIDPNPIGALNDQGRNYFLSLNPYKLISYAAFGEIYYNVTPDLKLTAGLRFTVDRKTAPQIPSWLLATRSGGVTDRRVAGEYPTAQTVFQEWREPTGRFAIDWKPHLGFTDETLVYASYAHGYKAGGANPPPPVLATYTAIDAQEFLPDTFGPEFVDAFEVGTKNTLLDGALTMNLAGFYYDYKGYQISEIRNRSAVNENYDAEVWGVEVEADWRATDALRLGFKGGYNGTRIADGQSAIDLMDRTAGREGWYAFRPFPTIPSNCILPGYVIAAGGTISVLGNSADGHCIQTYYGGKDPVTNLPYDPTITNYALAPKAGGGVLGPAYADYPGFNPFDPELNGGDGFAKDIGGNELPNAPQYTATLTADYTRPLAGDWMLTLHGDYHWQSESWWRIFNDLDYDHLEGFSTVNFSAIFTNEDAGWKVMAYVKNVFDETALTGAFLNSDDTGLTTNVFLTEPRLYGLRVTKDFTGGGWLGEIGRCGPDGCPVTVEIGGGVGYYSAETQAISPPWLEFYSPTFPLSQAFQDVALDRGDMRSIKLAYAPSRDWRISTAYRFGRTNSGAAKTAGYEHVDGNIQRCTAPDTTKYDCYRGAPDNFFRAAARDAEEYAITDFMVGREVGFGAFGQGGASVLSAGLRHADLRSTSTVTMTGVPQRDTPPDFSSAFKAELYTTILQSNRDFEGLGPSVAWDASLRLLGDEDRGHADLDWAVSGGVLFGKQSMGSDEQRVAYYYATVSEVPTSTLYDDVVPRHRAEDVTVPNVSLSLGLSYAIDRIKVSTGYSYDRFFDAIDGGYTESRTYDRTVHGPYLKLSLGFGG